VKVDPDVQAQLGLEAARAAAWEVDPAPRKPSPSPAALIDFEKAAPNHPAERKVKARMVRKTFNLSLPVYYFHLFRAVQSAEGLKHDALTCFSILGERDARRRKRVHLREVGA
jgi:hypothetical protein